MRDKTEPPERIRPYRALVYRDNMPSCVERPASRRPLMAFVKQLWPGEDSIGKIIVTSDNKR